VIFVVMLQDQTCP